MIVPAVCRPCGLELTTPHKSENIQSCWEGTCQRCGKKTSVAPIYDYGRPKLEGDR